MRNTNHPMINLEDTNFIFSTNFAGDPSKSRFNDSRRVANILIPSKKQAQEMIDMGLKVRETKPRQDDDPSTFEPEYFVNAVLKYRNNSGEPVKYQPRVYLVTDDGQNVKLLDEDTVDIIDRIRVKNVCAMLNPYEYDQENHNFSLYIRTMYVEQDLSDDPYAERYRKVKNRITGDMVFEDEADLPF